MSRVSRRKEAAAYTERADDDFETRFDEHDDAVERFAQTGDPAALAALVEGVTGVEVKSVKVTRPKRAPRAAAG